MTNAECKVSDDLGYQFYATFGAFYLPLAVMIVIYYRIYMVSARIAQAEAKSKPNGSDAVPPPPARLHCVTYTPKGGVGAVEGATEQSVGAREGGLVATRTSVADPAALEAPVGSPRLSIASPAPNGAPAAPQDVSDLQLAPSPARDAPKAARHGGILGKRFKRPGGLTKPRAASKASALQSNECKATRTLGIIMGAFTACWLPFFILALVR